MSRILASQRGQRLPAYSITPHTSRAIQLVNSNALEYHESRLRNSIALIQKSTNAMKTEICNAVLRRRNES